MNLSFRCLPEKPCILQVTAAKATCVRMHACTHAHTSTVEAPSEVPLLLTSMCGIRDALV